jgi:hypothetical protein
MGTSQSIQTLYSLSEITDLVTKGGSVTTLTDYNMIGYDGAGNRLHMTASVAAHTACRGTVNYVYDDNSSHDARSQLVTESASSRNGGYS